MRYLHGTGVEAVPWQNEVNELTVTTRGGGNREIILDTGTASIQGHYYKNDASIVFNMDVNTNPAGTRADLLVLECKWGTGASISAKIVPGIPGTVWPAGYASRTGLPRPVDVTSNQNPGTLWQLAIAQINVAYNAATIATADITDMRNFINAGSATSDTYIIASDTAAPWVKANANAVIPAGSLNAQDIINYGIQQISTLYGGGTVKLSEGIFNTSGFINCLSNVNIKGTGWGTKIYYQTAGGYNPIFYLNNANWVTISDMYIDGGGIAFGRGTVPANPNSMASGIIVYESSVDTIKNVYINACRNAGIWINTQGASSWGHRVEGNYITGCYQSGIYTTGSQGIYTNNQVRYNGEGIVLAGVSGSIGAESNIVSTNQVGFNYHRGIVLDASSAWTVYRNQITNNILNSNCIDANNTYAQLYLFGAGCQNNSMSMNQIYTGSAMAAYKPQYGIYLDTTVLNNVVTLNECAAAAYSASNNIKCTRSGSSNISPNKIRFNQSGCVAPDASSYDA